MKKYFEYTDSISNKFWEVNVKGKDVIVTYGRIGIKNPASSTKECVDNKSAKAYAEKKIREKINKGYIAK